MGGCPAQIYPNRADAGRSYTPVCFIAYFTRPTQISISIRIGGVLHVQNSVLLIIDSFDAFGGSGCSDFSRDFFLLGGFVIGSSLRAGVIVWGFSEVGYR